MKKIPPWLWVTTAVVGIWYLSKPKTTGAAGAATGAASAVGGSSAGRFGGHGGHVGGHFHGDGGHGGGHFHGGGGRGFVGRSVDVYNYGGPIELECDPRFPCSRQPNLPCRCG